MSVIDNNYKKRIAESVRTSPQLRKRIQREPITEVTGGGDYLAGSSVD